MTDTNTDGWPDDAREALEWVLAIHFSQNRQPCMSGDPRDRLSPMQRRNMEDARDAVLEALAPILKAREAAAAMAMRDACADVAREYTSPSPLHNHGPAGASRIEKAEMTQARIIEEDIRALPLPDTSALDALLAQAREEGRKEEREAGRQAIEAEAEAIRAGHPPVPAEKEINSIIR